MDLANPAPISCPNAWPRDLRTPAPRLTCSLASVRIRPEEDFCKRLESGPSRSQTVRPCPRAIQTPFKSCAPRLPSSLSGSKMSSTTPHCLQSLVLHHPLRVPQSHLHLRAQSLHQTPFSENLLHVPFIFCQDPDYSEGGKTLKKYCKSALPRRRKKKLR